MVNGKQKGKRGELELAHFLTDHGHPARRGQQFKGTPDSPDVECESLGFLNIECKRVENLNINKAMDKSREDAGESQIPVVCHRRNGKKWLITLDLENFLKLINDKI
jgi:Holliday junction resolvase